MTIATLTSAGGAASADPRPPTLMRETGENTTVIDAFDEDDPFDANLILGIRQSWKSANIRRETSDPGISNGGYLSAGQNIAAYHQSLTTLDLGFDIGIWKDLAFSFRVPIVLQDARSMESLEGSSGNDLFGVPFHSKTRSGIDYLQLGLDYAIFNQTRDDTKPNWVVGVMSRFAVGERMHACNEAAAVKCPDPANPSLGRDAGISRGMTMLEGHTTFSRRIGYLEPYAGFGISFEFPQSNSDYGRTDDSKGQLLDRPPAVGTLLVGTEYFPYENHEEFKRVGIDFRMKAAYHSPGREYSELFDALGTSNAVGLRSPNPGGYRAEGFSSVADPTKNSVFFTGITDQEAFGTFGGSISGTWQAGKYVKVNAGFGLSFAQSHLVTSADACNPDFTNDFGASGPCRTGASNAAGGNVTGIPNPNHRPAIDLPGRRFSVDDTSIVDLWLTGVVMF